MATALLLGLRVAKRSQVFVVSASKARAIVAKRSSSPIAMALHVTRTAEALGNPYDMKLARCFRFTFGVHSAIQDTGMGHTEEMRWGNRSYRSGGRQGWQARGQGQQLLGRLATRLWPG